MNTLIGVGLLTAACAVAAACGESQPGPGADGTGSGGLGSDGLGSGGLGSDGLGSGGLGSGGDPAGAGGTPGAGGAPEGSGGLGSGGSLGSGGGSGGSACDPTQEAPTLNVAPRSDTSADYDDNDFDDVVVTYQCEVAIVTATWPHEEGWEDADPAEANSEATKFQLNHPYTEDLTGKQLSLHVKLVEDGRGPTATNGGYTVYLGANDNSDYSEVATSWSEEYVGQLYGAGEEADIVFPIPTDNANFDATDIFQIFVRIESKLWEGEEIFDYATSVFEISALTVTDAPPP